MSPANLLRHDWPHSPIHRLNEAGAYIVTAGTYRKEHFFKNSARLGFLQMNLFALVQEFKWNLEAWALFSNHYHFVAMAESKPEPLRRLVMAFHSETARQVNKMDGTPGRKVWFQYWDSHISYEKSHFARLN